MKRQNPPGIEGLSHASVWDGKKWKTVKNLGWLLSHWKNVEFFRVIPSVQHMVETTLIAFLHDGKVFATPYASRVVLVDFLNRPTFQGAPIDWFGKQTVITKGLQ